MCLAVGNASMYDLELPARGRDDARRVAMTLVERLGDGAARAASPPARVG
jgi:hypothetical protein